MAQRLTIEMSETFTVTFSECVENHAGMQQYGAKSARGFTLGELLRAKQIAEAGGYATEFIDLTRVLDVKQLELVPKESRSSACVLIIRGGAKLFFKPEDYSKLAKEMEATKQLVDKKAVMRGKVVNKHARWNLCYADAHQNAKIEEGKGTILAFDEVPQLKQVRGFLPALLGDAAKGLFAELNYYYDTRKCGIGYHGDTERRFVAGLRLGASFPLHYQWYHQSNPIGPNISLEVNGDDFYVMGEKAVGTDWKTRKVPTLRHAAGFDKRYIEPKIKAPVGDAALPLPGQ